MIRIARESDAEAILAIYGPIVLETPISFETDRPSVEDFRKRILEIEKQFPWLVDERDGQIAGYVYASPHRTRRAYQWSVEVSAYVNPDFKRKGVARSLYLRLFEILKMQGYCNAYAGIALPNDPSVALHESLGFKSIGVYREIGYKLGAWHDVGWWHLRLKDLDLAPSTPIPFPDCAYSQKKV